jgi:DNA mismatch repair protein MutL
MIELLPDAIANQIAAGEVIQRPASVVKELLENSIDAEATSIQLIVKDSGKTLVQVVDDGKGMDSTDARLSFERHATSKIKTSEDLFQIKTMGFRGEALSSIAAVAQVDLKTRTKENEAGTHIIMEGSEMQDQQAHAMTPGTNIRVKNLFFNVPARRKFLKSNAVEMRHIQDEFTRIAMAHPGIAFRLQHNDKEIYHLKPQSLRKRIVAIQGKNWDEQLVPVEEETDIVNIHGFVGKPEKSKKTRGDQYFFINGRYFKSGYLHHAVMGAFQDLIPKDHLPFYALFLEMDPSSIDVNVHPTKQEVKFEDQRLIYNYLKVAIRHALGKYQVIPTIDFDQSSPFSENRGKGGPTFGSSFSKERPKGSPDDWAHFFGGSEEESEGSMTISSKVNLEEGEEQHDQLFGGDSSAPYQIHKAYILSPIQSGFIIIDQELAHERILYEEYLKILQEQNIQIQQQLYPSTVDLPAADAHILEDMLPVLQKLGFDIQEFGQNTFIIHGIPSAAFDMPSAEDLIEELLDHYKNDRDTELSLSENVAKSLARSAAIKKGKKLEAEEIEHLIGKLFSCKEPSFAPSGRKCFITFTLEDLQKKFSKP